MDPNDYITAWAVYLGGAAVIAILGWRVLHRFVVMELAILLECWLLALMLTPYYVLPEDDTIMAPALLVFAMDAITIEPTAGIRALIPLVMALALGLVVAVVLALVYRMMLRRQASTAIAAEPAYVREQVAAKAYAEHAEPELDFGEPTLVMESSSEETSPARPRKPRARKKSAEEGEAKPAKPRARRKKTDEPQQ